MLGREHAEAAAVAVGVEHAGILGEARHEAAVIALVVEPAGLLAIGQVGHEARVVLDQLDRPGEFALGDHRLALQPFELPHR